MDGIQHDCSPGALVRAVEANTLAYYAHFATLPGAQHHAGTELTWFVTGIAEDLFNGVLQARFARGSLDAQIETALDPFRRARLPMLWHIGPSSSPSELGSALTRYGVTHVEDEPGMALDLLAVDEAVPLPAGLSITPVADSAAMRQWVRVWANRATPEDVIQRCISAHAGLGFDAERPLRHYIGWLNGVPVATVALFYGAGVVSVQHVVTVDEARRKGIGEAMTRFALREARACGYRIGVLTASPMGQPIYERIGFRRYCTMRTYQYLPPAG